MMAQDYRELVEISRSMSMLLDPLQAMYGYLPQNLHMEDDVVEPLSDRLGRISANKA